jgi:phosphatidylserine/phosphatidylglycerophosphate/cardiolipin synthase-like enzyme
MPLKIGNVELHMGPHPIPAPPRGKSRDDLQKAIVNFIDGAQKRLDIAVQELDDWEIGKAILRARERKVTVRLVLEADYLRAARALSDPLQPGGSHEINRAIHNAVLRSAAKVNSDFNPSIFHQKFIVRDRKSVLTGSTNFTETGTHNNLNHVVIIRNENVAKTYWREFQEIQQGHFGKLNEGHDIAPPEAVVSGLRIRVLFAPDHNPEMEIMKQMAKARREIDFAIFTFSKSSGIDDQMMALARAGIKIRGVLDGRQASHDWAVTETLKGHVELYTVRRHSGLGKLHHKIMVIDRQAVIAGSFNYTGPANRVNDENIIVIGKLGTTNRNQVNAQKKFATFAWQEIDQIIKQFGRRVR